MKMETRGIHNFVNVVAIANLLQTFLYYLVCVIWKF